MTSAPRAIIVLATIAIGWTLMDLAYDKPEWYLQTIGVAGLLLTLSGIVELFALVRRAKK